MAVGKQIAKKQRKKMLGLGIRNKLMFWFLLISLLPMAVIGIVGYRLSAGSLEKQSFNSLESTLGLQKKALDDYFNERVRILNSLTENVGMMLNKRFEKMGIVKSLKKKQVEEYFQSLLTDVKVFTASPQQLKAMAAFRNSSTAAGKQYHSFFTEWLAGRDFSSMILVDDSGKVLYSSDGVIAPGASILNYAGSPEEAAYKNGRKGPVFTDFKQSSLRDNEPAGYISAPLADGAGARSGVALFRLDNHGFDAILQDNSGLGKSGESYLVGRDRLFRSNSTYFEEMTLASPAFLVDTESVAAALKGESGENIIINYRGEYVLSSYEEVKIAGESWALVVEIDMVENISPKHEGEELDYLAGYAVNYGFPDLYLLDPDGYIFYSAEHGPDYQANMLTGPYSDSGLSDTVRKVLASKDMIISDYKRYQPAKNKPTAFMAQPYLHNEQVVLIVAMQIPIHQIHSILNPKAGSIHGLGHEASTYLIGQDKLWRTESAHADEFGVESTLLNPKAALNTEAVTEALAGNNGTKLTTNGLGEQVLSSWAPFTFKGLKWALVRDAHLEAVTKPANNLLKLMAIISGIAVLAVFIASLLASGGITRQVRAIMGAMSKVEDGDYDTRAEVISTDELGAMAASFNGMIATTKDLMKARQEEHNQLQESIIALLDEISAVADGDISVRATVREDVTGTMADSLNMMLDEFHQALAQIKKSSEQVGSTADQLSASTSKLAVRNDSQFSYIKNAVLEIKQMTMAIKESALQARKSAATSELSRKASAEGTKAVEETSRAMEAIRRNIQDTARAIKRLGESSQEISDFAKTINEISDRTSILALNASIQASAAGEEGRGFAVVADEIQRLAERAAGSTKQIDTLVKNILGEITEAGASMDASIQEVVQGTTLSENALSRLEDINTRSAEVAQLIGAVASASAKQAAASVKIANTMGAIGSVSAKTAQETKNTSTSMKQMSSVANEMLKSVATFKLKDEDQKVV